DLNDTFDISVISDEDFIMRQNGEKHWPGPNLLIKATARAGFTHLHIVRETPTTGYVYRSTEERFMVRQEARFQRDVQLFAQALQGLALGAAGVGKIIA